MKYVRTKDEVSVLSTKHEHLAQEYGAIKVADTIEELCDVYVVERFKHIFTIDEISKNIVRNCKESDVYAAIWIKGKNGEPIVKSVARMKGISPLGKIDWELL